VKKNSGKDVEVANFGLNVAISPKNIWQSLENTNYGTRNFDQNLEHL